MKNLSVIFAILVLMMGGCVVKKPSFDTSHQKVLENATDALDIGARLKDKLRMGAKVSMRPLEYEKNSDLPLTSLIEDISIRSMLKNGFRVLERDEEAVDHLLLENGKWLKVDQEMQDISQTISVEQMNIETLQSIMQPSVGYMSSPLHSADYILSYRILEAGVKVNSLNDGFQWSDILDQYLNYQWWISEKQIELETMMRLHVRALDTKTGQIIYAQNLMNISKEVMDEK